MSESLLKEDPLSRIQREIIEVTEREREFKEGHFRMSRLLSESTLDVAGQNGNSHALSNGHARQLHRAVSTSTLLGPLPPPVAQPATAPSANGHANGYTRRFTPQNGTKGLMQRFIANKGKIPLASPGATSTPIIPAAPISYSTTPIIAPAVISPAIISPPIIERTPEGKPVRKGYVPVEEKIQKELQEMKNREQELKKMRRQQRPYELELSDEEFESESDEEDIPMPGKLKATKSIGELYEALNDELRSPSPRTASGNDSIGSLKPAKSLAELCHLGPGEEFLAPTSTSLIAKWESLIQQKQEAGAA